ncbi:MAG: NAD(P)/FAD-dependent oxidoreductase, partial [Aeromonas veronii]
MQAGKHNGYQEHVASYYAATRNDSQQWPELEGEHKADVCIIGGGFTGLNTAINLADAGYKVALLEANRIGWGASGRNGGQLIRGIGHDTSQFARWIGEQGVRELDLMGLEAVQLVRERVERFNIDCDLTWGYCDLATRQRHLAGFEEELDHLASLGYEHELKLVPREDIHSVVGSDRYIGGLIDMGSGHLHPLNLALGEARAAASLGVSLFEHSRVTHIDYGKQVEVTTAHGRVTADYLVIGCNAYLNDLNPELGGRVLPAGSYILATEVLDRRLRQRLLPQNMAVCDQNV